MVCWLRLLALEVVANQLLDWPPEEGELMAFIPNTTILN
jgi:hypothetical protein